jgi:P27 family predicted phage terminase small subunit
MRPISKEIKEMQGTFEPSKEGLEPVQFNQYERNPSAPAGWPPHIQKHWSDLCTDLKKAGYLMRAFMPGLVSYCFAILQRDEAQEKLMSEGFVITKITTAGTADVPSPWLTVLAQANKEIANFGAKYGLTPLDVQKIPAIEKKQGTEMSLLK